MALLAQWGSSAEALLRSYYTDRRMSDLTSLTAQDLRQAFADASAMQTLVPNTPAAVVAMVLQVDKGILKLCLGRRAAVQGDPWSGDLAFPGGKPEMDDLTLHGTAAREAFEEVGLLLPAECLVGDLGQMHALGGRKPVATFPLIYLLNEPPPPFRLGHELVDAGWVCLPELWDAANWVRFTYPQNGRDYAAVRAMGHYLWGFSLRVLHEFSVRVERPLTSLMEDLSLPRIDSTLIAGT